MAVFLMYIYYKLYLDLFLKPWPPPLLAGTVARHICIGL